MVVKHGGGKDELSGSLHLVEFFQMRWSCRHSALQSTGVSSIEPSYYEMQLSDLSISLLSLCEQKNLERTRFELVTSSMPLKRATNCANAPRNVYIAYNIFAK